MKTRKHLYKFYILRYEQIKKTNTKKQKSKKKKQVNMTNIAVFSDQTHDRQNERAVS